eukprot:m.55027 g.55027  ORF g.55027 m.55027 type:complete len:105 (+) comp13649_c0_seq23:140-454(+)
MSATLSARGAQGRGGKRRAGRASATFETDRLTEHVVGHVRQSTEVGDTEPACKREQAMFGKTKSSRLNRWSMALAEYDCKIVHVPGSQHADADYLSRPPFSFSF